VTKTLIRMVSALAAALFLSGAAPTVAATEKRALPPFTVTRLDGTAIDSRQLTVEPQYVLLYVRPECRPCDRLLALVRNAKSPQFTSRVVVIVSGEADAGAAYVARQIPAEAGPLTWYADPQGAGYRALRLSGMPELIGVKDGQMMWSVAGVLNDAATVESVVRTWVTY
jgi:hypothetical protein